MAGIINAHRGMARTTDTVPARLTPGEMVLPPDVVKKEGERRLAAMIARDHTPSKAPVVPGRGYADGGLVTPGMKLNDAAPNPLDDSSNGGRPALDSANPIARNGPPDIPSNVPTTPTTPDASGGNPIARPPGPPTLPDSGNTGADGNPIARGGNTNIVQPKTMDTGGSMLPGSGTSATKSATDPNLAWNPTSGIVDQIRGITPQNVTSTGYTSGGVGAVAGPDTTGYDATGYTAQQGTAATSDENLSQAVDRITSKGGPLMDRAAAEGTAAANARGLVNSSMAVGAAQGAVLDRAILMGQGDVANAQFNAQAKNMMTINNVDEANKAAAFHADATNAAAQFAANARNAASAQTSAQAQQRSLEAAQLWDQASQFSAAAKQAADSQNAQAYNDAMQKFVDARNAAVAAQNDAENLARRDTAQIAAQQQIANTQAGATVAAASAHGAAMVQAAKISADASAAMNKASLTERQQEFQASQGTQQLDTYLQGMQNIDLAGLEPDARQNALHNYNAVWAATGDLPFNIDMSAFPAATTPPPPGP